MSIEKLYEMSLFTREQRSLTTYFSICKFELLNTLQKDYYKLEALFFLASSRSVIISNELFETKLNGPYLSYVESEEEEPTAVEIEINCVQEMQDLRMK